MTKSEILCIRMTPAMRDILRKLAANEQRSMGNMVLLMMVEYMRNHPEIPHPLPEPVVEPPE